MQAENEKQQKQIKRLKDFRGDTHSEMDIILNELIVKPVSEHALITLDKTTITQGDYLEFIVNLEPIVEQRLWYDEPIKIEKIEFEISEHDLFDLEMEYNGADNISNNTEGWSIEYNERIDGERSDASYKVKSKYTNYTTFTIKIPIPSDNKIGLHDVYVSSIEAEWNFKESEHMLHMAKYSPDQFYHLESHEIVRMTTDHPCDQNCIREIPEMRTDLQYIMMP